MSCQLPTDRSRGLAPRPNQRRHSHGSGSIGATTNEPVDRDSPAGNLECVLVGKAATPLQQGLDGHRKASLSVSVHDLAAFSASEQGVVPTVMSLLPDCTAVGTPFGRVVGIHRVQRNPTVEATGLKNPLEEKEWYCHGPLVEPFTFWTEPSMNLGDVSRGQGR
jgi:hypothetical protein